MEVVFIVGLICGYISWKKKREDILAGKREGVPEMDLFDYFLLRK